MEKFKMSEAIYNNIGLGFDVSPLMVKKHKAFCQVCRQELVKGLYVVKRTSYHYQGSNSVYWHPECFEKQLLPTRRKLKAMLPSIEKANTTRLQFLPEISALCGVEQPYPWHDEDALLFAHLFRILFQRKRGECLYHRFGVVVSSFYATSLTSAVNERIFG